MGSAENTSTSKLTHHNYAVSLMWCRLPFFTLFLADFIFKNFWVGETGLTIMEFENRSLTDFSIPDGKV